MRWGCTFKLEKQRAALRHAESSKHAGTLWHWQIKLNCRCHWHLYDAFRHLLQRQWDACGRPDSKHLRSTWERERGQILRHSGKSGSRCVVFIHLRVCIEQSSPNQITDLFFSHQLHDMEVSLVHLQELGMLYLYFSLYHANSLQPFRIKVNFKNSHGDLIKTVEVNEGDDILSIAHEHDIDLEGA